MLNSECSLIEAPKCTPALWRGWPDHFKLCKGTASLGLGKLQTLHRMHLVCNFGTMGMESKFAA